MIEEENYKFNGFYTEEVKSQDGNRIGFDIVLVKNREERTILARIELVLFYNNIKFNLFFI